MQTVENMPLWPAAVYFIASAALVVLMIGLSYVLGQRHKDRTTGEPLKDSKGRVTSHLSGLFYRTTNLLEAGIKPVFVFDGKPPAFKRRTIQAREEAKEEAKKKSVEN